MARIWLFAGAVAAALSPPLPQGAQTTRLQAQKAKQDDPRRRKTPELFDEVQGPGIHLKNKPEVIYHCANVVYGITGNYNNGFNLMIMMG